MTGTYPLAFIGDAVDMLDFWGRLHEWSAKTFGTREERGPIGPLKHLEKEAREAYTETDPAKQREEIADTLFLVFDAANRAGMSYADLTAECNKKLQKNRARVWPKSVGDTPTEHVRE